MISLLVRNYSWIFMLQRNGVLNMVMGYLGLIDQPLKLFIAEHAFVFIIGHTVRRAMIAAVDDEKFDIAPLEGEVVCRFVFLAVCFGMRLSP